MFHCILDDGHYIGVYVYMFVHGGPHVY